MLTARRPPPPTINHAAHSPNEPRTHVNGAPKLASTSVDGDDHSLFQEPRITQSSLAPSGPMRVRGPELEALWAYRFVGHDNAALCE